MVANILVAAFLFLLASAAVLGATEGSTSALDGYDHRYDHALTVDLGSDIPDARAQCRSSKMARSLD